MLGTLILFSISYMGWSFPLTFIFFKMDKTTNQINLGHQFFLWFGMALSLCCRIDENCLELGRIWLQLLVSLQRYYGSPLVPHGGERKLTQHQSTCNMGDNRGIFCRCKTCIEAVWSQQIWGLCFYHLLSLFVFSIVFHFCSNQRSFYAQFSSHQLKTARIFLQLRGWSTRLAQWLATGQHLVLCCDGCLRSLVKDALKPKIVVLCAGNPWFFTTKEWKYFTALGCSVQLLC